MWEEMEATAGEGIVLSTGGARAQQCGPYRQVLLAWPPSLHLASHALVPLPLS